MSTRTHAAIRHSIWDDQDFIALSPGAQLVYLFLLSQADLAWSGVLPLTVTRWADMLPRLGEERIKAALAELAEARFIVLDERTQELAIRTFVRNDGLWRQPRLLGCSIREARRVRSATIRRAYGIELVRLLQDPDTAEEAARKFSDANAAAAYELAGEAAPTKLPPPEPPHPQGHAQPLGNPSANPSARDEAAPPPTPRQGTGAGAGAGAGAPAPAPQTPPTPHQRGETARPSTCERHRRSSRPRPNCRDCTRATAIATDPPPCGETPGLHGSGRMAEGPDGTAYPCPTCHPAGRAAADGQPPPRFTLVAGGA